MDVTREVTFASTNAAVLTTSGTRGDPFVEAAGVGTAEIYVSGGASYLTAADSAGRLVMAVTDTPVTVTALDGVAARSVSFTGASFPPPTQVPAVAQDESQTVQVNLLQGLFAIGDYAYVFAYATFSDGTIQQVDSTMGLVATSLKTASVVVAANPLR
eukprot:2069080-Pyramimonas_sp.AAC.1